MATELLFLRSHRIISSKPDSHRFSEEDKPGSRIMQGKNWMSSFLKMGLAYAVDSWHHLMRAQNRWMVHWNYFMYFYLHDLQTVLRDFFIMSIL